MGDNDTGIARILGLLVNGAHVYPSTFYSGVAIFIIEVERTCLIPFSENFKFPLTDGPSFAPATKAILKKEKK